MELFSKFTYWFESAIAADSQGSIRFMVFNIVTIPLGLFVDKPSEVFIEFIKSLIQVIRINIRYFF